MPATAQTIFFDGNANITQQDRKREMIALIVMCLWAMYLTLVTLLLVGWKQAISKRPEQTTIHVNAKLPVTVVVAARNEESQITFLLADLLAQHYPDFEVIVVDDHSHDRTVQICREFVAQDHRFSLVRSPGAGKKNALSEGVRRATGALIVTTDADCRVGPQWLSIWAQQFHDPETKFCFGGVTMAGPTLFDHMQSLEFATLVGTGAATAAWNHPTMCNAANLAYRKSAFDAVGGYEGNLEIPSGDDEFLMRKINQAYPRSVRYCAESNAVVATRPSPDLASFFFQRIRWAGKWQSNTDTTTKLLAVFVFAFHLAVTALPALVATNTVSPLAAITGLLTKAIVEFIFIRRVQSALKQPWHWGAFIVLQAVYSYYVVMVALCAPFSTFDWKGRRLKPFMARGQ